MNEIKRFLFFTAVSLVILNSYAVSVNVDDIGLNPNFKYFCDLAILGNIQSIGFNNLISSPITCSKNTNYFNNNVVIVAYNDDNDLSLALRKYSSSTPYDSLNYFKVKYWQGGTSTQILSQLYCEVDLRVVLWRFLKGRCLWGGYLNDEIETPKKNLTNR